MRVNLHVTNSVMSAAAAQEKLALYTCTEARHGVEAQEECCSERALHVCSHKCDVYLTPIRFLQAAWLPDSAQDRRHGSPYTTQDLTHVLPVIYRDSAALCSSVCYRLLYILV